MARSKGRFARRYGGWLAAALILFAWLTSSLGPGALVLLSFATLIYFGVLAPLICGAVNRDGRTYCRNNSQGLLFGCSLRSHKLQRFKAIFYRSRWGQLGRAWFGNTLNGAAVITALFTAISTVAGLITLSLA